MLGGVFVRQIPWMAKFFSWRGSLSNGIPFLSDSADELNIVYSKGREEILGPFRYDKRPHALPVFRLI